MARHFATKILNRTRLQHAIGFDGRAHEPYELCHGTVLPTRIERLNDVHSSSDTVNLFGVLVLQDEG